MKITRDNYEPFFLDFLEGNLEENHIDQFLDFMEQNPDLKEELQQVENVCLPDEKIIFSEKNQLYKSEADQRIAFENKVVACLEGDLENDERKAFKAYLAEQPELQKEYDLYTKTLLIPDPGIKYPDKQKLYRKSGYTILLNWVARAAAVIVLLWGISSLFQNGNQTEPVKFNQEMAELIPKSESPSEIMKSEKKIQGPVVQEKIKQAKPKKISAQISGIPEEKFPDNASPIERDLTALAEITPIMAKLDIESVESQLAVSHSVHMEKISDQRNIMTLEEFLANRVKKAGDEGLLSAQRIFRSGLNVASELSGDRIGYKVTDGKITSVDFESRLMAFSIPLKKE